MYILIYPIPYEGGIFHGVFSTFEKAEKVAKDKFPDSKFKEVKTEEYKTWSARHFSIVEVETDKEVMLYI